MIDYMTKMERGVQSSAQAESIKDEYIIKALWNEIYLRNQTRIADALKKGGKDRATLEKKFSTIPFEEILEKIQKEAA